MVIGFTYEISKHYKLTADDPPDRYFEFDSEFIIQTICRAIEKNGHKVVRIGSFADLLSDLDNVKKNIDVVFNLSEGLFGRNREAWVPTVLESAGIPFIGSDALTMSLTLDKVATKKFLIADGIPTPGYFATDTPLTLDQPVPLSFPLIVKPQWEGSSKGITKNSKVMTKEELNEQILFIGEKYHQPALIEEFIAGREFTIGIIGNGKNLEVFPVIEITYRGEPLGKKYYFGRYVNTSDMRLICPATIDVKLSNTLKELAKHVYLSVDCRDIGRVDIRVDEKENPFVLEINPLPALSRQDAFGTFAKVLKISYSAMIEKILSASFRRYGIAEK